VIPEPFNTWILLIAGFSVVVTPLVMLWGMIFTRVMEFRPDWSAVYRRLIFLLPVYAVVMSVLLTVFCGHGRPMWILFVVCALDAVLWQVNRRFIPTNQA